MTSTQMGEGQFSQKWARVDSGGERSKPYIRAQQKYF